MYCDGMNGIVKRYAAERTAELELAATFLLASAIVRACVFVFACMCSRTVRGVIACVCSDSLSIFQCPPATNELRKKQRLL